MPLLQGRIRKPSIRGLRHARRFIISCSTNCHIPTGMGLGYFGPALVFLATSLTEVTVPAPDQPLRLALATAAAVLRRNAGSETTIPRWQ